MGIRTLELGILVLALCGMYGISEAADRGSEDGWLLHIFLVAGVQFPAFGQWYQKTD